MDGTQRRHTGRAGGCPCSAGENEQGWPRGSSRGDSAGRTRPKEGRPPSLLPLSGEELRGEKEPAERHRQPRPRQRE